MRGNKVARCTHSLYMRVKRIDENECIFEKGEEGERDERGGRSEFSWDRGASGEVE